MKTATTDRFPAIQKKVQVMEREITTLEVVDEESLAQASDIVKNAKELAKELDKSKKEFTVPADEIIAAAKAKYDPAITFLKSVETQLKAKSAKYLMDKVAAAKVEEDRIAARVEKGTMRNDTGLKKMDEIDSSKETRTSSSGMRMTMHRDVAFDIEAIRTDGGTIVQMFTDGYLVPDMVKIRKDALAGVEIPGAKIIEKPVMHSI